MGPLDEPDVGLTGAKLYFSDSSIQHAGHGYWNKHYHHPFRYWTREEAGPFGELAVNREMTGVTAACSAMRREVFLDIGGFTEALPSNFNDVDLCLKVAHLGYRTVWVANCELFHFESQTRDGTVQAWDALRSARGDAPETVRSVLTDACFVCGERLLAAGDKQQAASVGKLLYAPAELPATRLPGGHTLGR